MELLAVLVILVCLMLLVLPTLKAAKDMAREARCMEELRDLEKNIQAYAIEKGNPPDSLADLQLRGGLPLDPWKRSYVYVNIAAGGASRVDAELNQLNSDFDLYSLGPDGASALSLEDQSSTDDVVRGQNGAFVGRAEKY